MSRIQQYGENGIVWDAVSRQWVQVVMRDDTREDFDGYFLRNDMGVIYYRLEPELDF